MFKEMFDLVIYLGVLDPDFLKEMMYKSFLGYVPDNIYQNTKDVKKSTFSVNSSHESYNIFCLHLHYKFCYNFV